MIGKLRVLLLIAMRNLFSHKVKNLIVGAIMAFGTFLLVLGTSLLDSVETSMQETITASLTGHIQVYAADAADELAFFGGFGQAQDFGEIENFPTVESALLEFDEVKAVVPMALGTATSFGRSELDEALAELRAAVDAADPERQKRAVAHVRQLAGRLVGEFERQMEITAAEETKREELAIARRVAGDEFWDELQERPEDALFYLDTKFAPLVPEGEFVFIRYLATDPTQFREVFDRFQVVEGEMIPQGRRGILVGERYRERALKNNVARLFDELHADFEEGQRFDRDESMRNRADRMHRQYGDLVFELDPRETREVRSKLQTYLGKPDIQDLSELMGLFLEVDDANFVERHAFFYDEIAPEIELYDVYPGDMLTLSGFTQSGYLRSVNVKVWGVANFRGLETSDLAGSTNIMDLVTFRELYGKMTPEQKAELADIKEEVGVETVRREEAEAALFGGGGELVAEANEEEMSETFGQIGSIEAKEALDDRVYSAEEMRNGLAVSAAVLLEDPSRVDEMIDSIETLSEERGLGIQATDWQSASGLVGQFILVIQLVLYTAIFIIFLVALVIINNSMVMAMMERTSEIGTMRAIGTQRNEVLVLVLLETLVLGIVGGTVGALGGAGLVLLLQTVGIPATNDVLVFIFGGPKLYPFVSIENLAIAVAVILVVSIISTLYPARVATQVQPIVAMRGKE
jgi:ABC-type lipoprotein release transport system permease subunit